MSELADRLRAASRDCQNWIFWRPLGTPAERFDALAAATRALAEDLPAANQWDAYGDGGAVTACEEEFAATLGHEAALVFPSGVMAQQAALRVWCERTGSRRVAIPDLSHLLHHEDDGPRLLHGFEFVPLTVGRQTPSAAALDAVPGALGAAMVELPLRDAGCLLPSWAELTELSERAREVGVPLHADGARIWESQPHLDHPLAEIGALFDSLYVSFYKGLGAVHGALVAGDQDFVDELKPWRRRMGGTLFRLTPIAIGGLHGLRTFVPHMGEYVAWARELTDHLRDRGFRVDPPASQTFVAYADGEPEVVNQRLLEYVEREQCVPCGSWTDAGVPGLIRQEFAVHAAALEWKPADVADILAGLVHG